MVGQRTPSHVAFSDDSKHEEGRYNSLGLVSFEMSNGTSLSAELTKLLTDSGFTSEFKWTNFADAKHRFAAEKMLNFALERMRNLRVDVIIWDNRDSRNAIIGRDDAANLVRMYYHLVATTFSKRWPIGGVVWRWLPDEQSSVDWLKLQAYIRTKKHPHIADLFGENPEFERVNISVTPAKSDRRVFIQLADLFAGMGAYSWGHFERFQAWKVQQRGTDLFGRNKIAFSKSERERFTVIDSFRESCRVRDMKIGLDSSRGLRSYDPTKRINFWLYEPQHALDKAPVQPQKSQRLREVN